MNIEYKAEESIFFCSYSGTIRQSPQNYLLAGIPGIRHEWMLMPDCAADKLIVMAVSLALLDSNAKTGSGATLINAAKKILLDLQATSVNPKIAVQL